jgi:hypothetical protein
MTAGGAVWLLRKDFRTLLPIWVACVVTITAASAHRTWMGLPPGATRNGLEGLAILAYGLGSIALGAQIIGGEYGWRTLPSLLMLPAPRWRILLAKLGALACLVAGLVLLAPAAWGSREPEINTILRLGPAYGLCVAPFLTMVCRGTLPGIVFTAVLAPMLFVAGQITGSAIYGSAAAEIDRFTYSFLRDGTALLCAAGVVLTVRAFMRLEATDGRSVDLPVPALGGAGQPGRRGSALRLLVGKELRLQQMSFIVVALFGMVWAAALALKRLRPELDVPPLGIEIGLFFSLLSLLIGSLASAEERQFGTTEWQALVPIASSRQWFVKLAVAFGLALAFFGSATVFVRLAPSLGAGLSSQALVFTIVEITVWVSVGLYASSLSTSGVRALALAVVLMLAITTVVPLIGRVEWWALHMATGSDPSAYTPIAFMYPSPLRTTGQTLIAGLCVLLLRLAFMNHRSAETGTARVWRQSAVLVAYLAAALMINGLVALA